MGGLDDIDFVVNRGNSEMGTHTIRFSHDGADLVTDVAIDLLVRIAFIPVFRYTHRNREVWRDGRLIRLDSTTDDDGTEYEVRARADGDVLRVTGSGGDYEAPADTLPTSYWNPGMLDATQLLNTQKGDLEKVAVSRVGRETVTANGVSVDADRYLMKGSIDVDMWYTPGDRRWVGLAFDARGSRVTYQPSARLLKAGG